MKQFSFTGSLSRRRFVGATAVAASWPWLGSGAAELSIDPQAISGNPFGLGVASGDPLPDGVILWTRLRLQVPEVYSGNPGGAVRVGWEVFSDEGATKPVARGTQAAWPELGHSVHVDVRGLRPGREYWYRFSCGAYQSVLGRTKTADPEAESVRFGVASCNNYEHGYFTAFDLMAEDRLDFIFHAGDYVYEKAPKPGQVRTHRGNACISLDDYRIRYTQYRLDPLMQKMHRSAPFIASWDDHEVAGNWADLDDKYGTPHEVFALRRAAAFQAFYEFMPIRVSRWMPGEPFPLYRRFRFGGAVQFLVLDTRQYRSDQACQDASWGAPCEGFSDPARTMIGASQSRWLEQQLRNGGDRWAIIGNQVPSYRRNGGTVEKPLYAMDKWDGYPHAQSAFHALLKEHANGRALVLSGDVHAHYASDLKLSWESEEPAFGAELSTTSVASGGDGQSVEERWPHLARQNPHLLYHSKRRGYMRCHATRDAIESHFVTLDRVSEPDGKATIDAVARWAFGGEGLALSRESSEWQSWG